MAPPLVLLPLKEEAPLPEMMQLVIVTAPVLRLKMPPPKLTSDPRVMVKPDSATLKLPEAILKMRNPGASAGIPSVLRRTVNRFAPGPLIVRFLLISNSPLVRLIVLRPAAKLMVSPDAASRIACRNVPPPLSPPLVTMMVAACAITPLKNRALVTNAKNNTRLLIFCHHSEHVSESINNRVSLSVLIIARRGGITRRARNRSHDTRKDRRVEMVNVNRGKCGL